MRLRRDCPANGAPTCSALPRCTDPPYAPSKYCRNHHEAAIALLHSLRTRDTGILSYLEKRVLLGEITLPEPVQPEDWSLPSRTYAVHLNILQDLTHQDSERRLLLTDSEFCTLPASKPSIFQLAVKRFRVSQPIVNANITYPGIDGSAACLDKIPQMNPYFLNVYSRGYYDTTVPRMTLADTRKILLQNDVGKKPHAVKFWVSSSDMTAVLRALVGKWGLVEPKDNWTSSFTTEGLWVNDLYLSHARLSRYDNHSFISYYTALWLDADSFFVLASRLP